MPFAFDKFKLFVFFCDRWRWWVDPRLGNHKIECLPLVSMFTAENPVVPHFSGYIGPRESTVWSEHFLLLLCAIRLCTKSSITRAWASTTINIIGSDARLICSIRIGKNIDSSKIYITHKRTLMMHEECGMWMRRVAEAPNNKTITGKKTIWPTVCASRAPHAEYNLLASPSICVNCAKRRYTAAVVSNVLPFRVPSLPNSVAV